MKEEFQTEDEISLLDIIRTLLEKIKLLIILVLIGGILGCSVAILSTVNVNYWGTSVEFYVNPESSETDTGDNSSQYGVYGAYGRHVMDNMIKLLSSESFAEKLILNNKVLPEKGVWVNAESSAEAALNLDAKIDAALAVLAEEQTHKSDVEAAKVAYDIAMKNYETALKRLNDEWKRLPASLNISSSYNDVDYFKHVQNKGYPNIDAAYEAVFSETDGAYEMMLKVKEEYDNKKIVAKELAENSAAIIEVALNAWRQTEKYQAELSKYSEAVVFSYLQADEDVEDANNLARSFIYVEVSVLNDQAFAKQLLERVKVVVPAYVKENMTVPSGYIGTNCQRITRSDDISLTNPDYTKNEAIKWTILSAFITGIIAAVVVIIVDRSDKRLKECDVLTKKFDLPILGIIPTIDAIANDANAKETKK